MLKIGCRILKSLREMTRGHESKVPGGGLALSVNEEGTCSNMSTNRSW